LKLSCQKELWSKGAFLTPPLFKRARETKKG
jgi:hypothetical protein